MGLKGVHRQSLYQKQASWNQTKMGLKDLHHLLPFHVFTAVEIRPRWDWKPSIPVSRRYRFAGVEIRPRWDWKLGVWILPLQKQCVEIRPRWDWKGNISKSSSSTTYTVEIRPRWDWKISYDHNICLPAYQLKSDQGGIESLKQTSSARPKTEVEIRPRWDWKKTSAKTSRIFSISCWNQTKVGLKVKSVPTKIIVSGVVEIRPRWDWKKTEISINSTRRIVEIRPRWDWKILLLVYVLPLITVEIRPRWDWKSHRFRGEHLCNQWQPLKSDQGGIEREGGGDFQRLKGVVEIRPRWDWKEADGWGSPDTQDRWNQTKVGLKAKTPALQTSVVTCLLKSDQGGIESSNVATVEDARRASWNQTKVGLKDLNFLKHSHAFHCWNQTKVGLKVDIRKYSFKPVFSVEIRPRWDWKAGTVRIQD